MRDRDDVGAGIGTIGPQGALQVPSQATLFDAATENGDEPERALLEQLIAATKLYNRSDAIQDLFDFTVRLRAFAPVQRNAAPYPEAGTYPRGDRTGLVDAVLAGCQGEGARPLLILRTMGSRGFCLRRSRYRGGGSFLTVPSSFRLSAT